MANRLSQIQSHLSNVTNGLFQDQVVVLTGAGNGIGRSAAKIFALEGAKVVVCDLDKEAAEKTAEEIQVDGGKALVFAGNICEENYPDQLAAFVEAKYGTVNILVNNAGFVWDSVIHKTSDKQWDVILDVHCRAPFRLIRAFSRFFRTNDHRNKAIINVSSTSGLHGNVGQINYSTAKSGIIGLTKAVAKEWGRYGVRCNVVALGFINTRLSSPKETAESITLDGQEVKLGIPLIDGKDARTVTGDVPLGRIGSRDEAAWGIVMMASPMASYITGHTLEVTGGRGI